MEDVTKLADKLGCCVVVKNIVDIIVYQGKVRLTRNTGSPKRCSGQGDVLAGAIACCVNYGAERIDQVAAACEAVKLAALKAFREKRLGTVAADVVQKLSEAVAELAPDNFQEYSILWDSTK